MPRRYITETIQEKIPVLVMGEDTAFRRILSRNMGDLYPEFEGVVVGRKQVEELGITSAPQAVVWIIENTAQFAKEEKRVQDLINTFQTKLYVISPEALHLESSLTESFREHVLLTVRALNPVEEGINACIHEMLGKSSSSGVFAIEFPGDRVKTESPQYRGITTELETWHRTEPEKLYQSEAHFVPLTVPAPSSELHVGFGQRILEQENPFILDPPPPLFSHMPSEHEVMGEIAEHGIANFFPGQRVEIPPQHSGFSESEGVRENIITSLFAKKGASSTSDVNRKKRGLFNRSAEQTVSKKIDKNSLSAKEKRRGIARKLLVGGVGFIMLLCVAGASVVYSMQSFMTEFDHYQGILFSDTADIETMTSATQSIGIKLPVVALINRAVQPFAQLIGQGQYSENFDEIYNVAQKEVTTAQTLDQYSQSLAKVYAGVMDIDKVDTFSAIQEATVNADKASKEVQLLSAELAKDNENTQIQLASANSGGYKKLVALRRDLLGSQHLFAQLPSILGKDRKQTYLILIQNPLELRPTGGFISAYALVTFEKGKLLDLQVQDSYLADDQLKGKVSPPIDLQKFLGEKQWYFRDSNWSANFPQSATQAEWFISKELGVNTDGVIGMTMYSLQSLLRVTGPVELESYDKEVVNADNLFERVQTKSELTFSINGEQKKKEYLTTVTEEVFNKLKALDPKQAKEFSASVFQLLAEGNLQLSVSDHDDEQVLERLGWNGQVMTPPCPQQFVGDECFVDTVYEVDTNVGVNRANYYVKKTATHTILLTPQAAVHSYTTRFTNNAVSSAWPSGPYKNYVRLYIPDYTQVNSVVVDQKPVSPENLIQTEENGKKIVGFYVETPIGGTSVATVNYSTILSGTNNFSYAVFTQKQPGVEPYPQSLSLHVQSPLVVKTLAPEGTITGNVIQIDNTIDKPQYMAVELGK